MAVHGKLSTAQIGSTEGTGVTFVATAGAGLSHEFIFTGCIFIVFCLINWEFSSTIVGGFFCGGSDAGLLRGALTITDTGMPVIAGTGVDGGVLVRSSYKRTIIN